MKFRLILVFYLCFFNGLFARSLPSFQAHDAREYYNTGLKYAKQGHFPMSIIYFKRAHLLKPLNKRYTEDLNKVRSFLNIPKQLFEPGPVESILLYPFFAIGMNRFLILGLLLLFSGSVILSLMLFKRGKFKNLAVYSRLLIGFGIFFLLASFILSKYTFNTRLAVVLKNSDIFQTPNEDASKVSDIQAGFECTVERSMGNYYLIKSVDGHEGWVLKSDLKKIW